MKLKLISSLLTILLVSSTTLFGCSANNVVDDTKNNIENNLDKAKDSIKDTGDSIIGKYDEEMMNLDKEGFIKKIEAKGFKVSEVSDGENNTDKNSDEYNFSVKKENLIINDQMISLYVYPNKEELDKDIKNIEGNDYWADGGKINQSNPPHIYRSGKLMVIYSGKNSEINNLLMDIFNSKIK